jgi:hypothetical protein
MLRACSAGDVERGEGGGEGRFAPSCEATYAPADLRSEASLLRPDPVELTPATSVTLMHECHARLSLTRESRSLLRSGQKLSGYGQVVASLWRLLVEAVRCVPQMTGNTFPYADHVQHYYQSTCEATGGLIARGSSGYAFI